LAPQARFVKGLVRELLKEDAALTVGVRPERLVSPAFGAVATKGAVELVERLGEFSFADIRRADGRMMVAEIRGRLDAEGSGRDRARRGFTRCACVR
jgi:ABC-type sugar transport system ATPase subunit